jgi:hypothetical protein
MNDTPVWHDRERWHDAVSLLDRMFKDREKELRGVAEHADELRKRIGVVSPFIQNNTAAVCPGCEKVCCINIHGYYDQNDLIYIYALGLRPLQYKAGLDDTAPCQFLSREGCGLERAVRPFRCNWYFCLSLTQWMENGPARPYRQFINSFQETVDLRRLMLDEFSRKADLLPAGPLIFSSS